jgi:hypothetical protein
MKHALLQITLVVVAGAALTILAGPQPVLAQHGHQSGFAVGGFVDENGDGFNDLAPDADGDGIPNGLDPDYVPPQDGNGNRLGQINAGENALQQLMNRWQYMWLRMFGGGGETGGPFSWGPGDGTGFGGDGPGDGTGFGPGTGCDTPLGDLRQQHRGGGRQP